MLGATDHENYDGESYDDFEDEEEDLEEADELIQQLE
jgi:hypothetical protein